MFVQVKQYSMNPSKFTCVGRNRKKAALASIVLSLIVCVLISFVLLARDGDA